MNAEHGEFDSPTQYQFHRKIIMSYDLKQMIILRKDLNMRKGKMIAQGAHASVRAVVLHMEDKKVKTWLKDGSAKIAVSVDTEQELVDIIEQATNAGIITEQVVDRGLTEFNGTPTLTAVALGPDTKNVLDPITGHLKLL